MAAERIGVDCQFELDGTIRVRRIFFGDRWLPVGQGRQWIDPLGRHVLIMLPEGQAREIRQRPDTMTWELLAAGGGLQSRMV